MAYKFVGKAVPRLEGAEKVSGKLRYAADFEIPGCSVRKILRTSLPHARIVKIDKSKAEQLPRRPRNYHWRRHTCGDGWPANERHAPVGD